MRAPGGVRPRHAGLHGGLVISHALHLQLADAFAAAALDRTRWMPALQLLAEATGSARAQLIGIGGPRAIPFNWVTDFPVRALREFVEIEGGSPHVNPRVYASDRARLMEQRRQRLDAGGRLRSPLLGITIAASRRRLPLARRRL